MRSHLLAHGFIYEIIKQSKHNVTATADVRN